SGGLLRRSSKGAGREARPLLPRSVDVRTLDQEGHADVCPPLIEVLTSETSADDVDRPDVAKRALGLLQRLLGGVIRRLLGASNHLDDLYDAHRISSLASGQN